MFLIFREPFMVFHIVADLSPPFSVYQKHYRLEIKGTKVAKNVFLTVYTFVHELIFTVTTVLKVWKHLQKISVVVEIKETKIFNFHAYINFYTTAKKFNISIVARVNEELFPHDHYWSWVIRIWCYFGSFIFGTKNRPSQFRNLIF